ncbi:MAG: clostripain-related cysteine peptidase, partial [Pseudothermotoga sp.]
MKRFSRNLIILCINVLIFILAGCAGLHQANWTIKAENQTKTVGRIGYIELKLTNQNGLSVSNAQINLMYKENDQWKTFKDALTGEETFVTDGNGVARVSVFPSKEAVWQFLGYLTDDPSIETTFVVNFKKPQWLFMIWMCADNDLEGNALKDIEEMKNGNNNISTFLIFDGRAGEDKFLVMDELGGWKTIEVFQQDLDSGDSSSLLEYLKNTFGWYEANNYSLILWDHGNAWIYDSAYKKEITSRAIAFDDTSKHA